MGLGIQAGLGTSPSLRSGNAPNKRGGDFDGGDAQVFARIGSVSNASELHPFLSIDIAAGPKVLAPRAETELLGRTAIELLADIGEPVVVDVCCGSGNLGLAIAHARPDATVYLTDLTDETVAQARSNADRLGLSPRVRIGQGDLFAGVADLLGGQGVDLIVCNPPYISTSKLAGDAAHLLEREPREAFDGGDYGIAVHQRLVSEAPNYLKPGGWLTFEFGLGQDRQVALLLKRSGRFGDISFANDDLGRPRVAYTRLS
jgi:release factor glutamine methyltransferase